MFESYASVLERHGFAIVRDHSGVERIPSEFMHRMPTHEVLTDVGRGELAGRPVELQVQLPVGPGSSYSGRIALAIVQSDAIAGGGRAATKVVESLVQIVNDVPIVPRLAMFLTLPVVAPLMAPGVLVFHGLRRRSLARQGLVRFPAVAVHKAFRRSFDVWARTEEEARAAFPEPLQRAMVEAGFWGVVRIEPGRAIVECSCSTSGRFARLLEQVLPRVLAGLP